MRRALRRWAAAWITSRNDGDGDIGPRPKRRATMEYPEVKGKVVDFIQASAQTEGAFVNIRFTDKTDLGLTFNARMKLTHASLNDASDGNFELVKEYEVPS